jgi:hypothetical protein
MKLSSSFHARLPSLMAVVANRRKEAMIKRFTTITAVLASAAVIAFAGVAVAQTGSKVHHKKATHHAIKHKKHLSHASLATGVDTDTIQSGDQTTPDSASASSEQSGEAPGSEVSGNDGPGGHEDEAGAEVDHQFEGVE